VPDPTIAPMKSRRGTVSMHSPVKWNTLAKLQNGNRVGPWSNLGTQCPLWVKSRQTTPGLKSGNVRYCPKADIPLQLIDVCYTQARDNGRVSARHRGGAYGSGVPIAIKGYFFTLASNSPTILRTGPKIQLSVITLSASSRGFV
jgi:hypothetical protein